MVTRYKKNGGKNVYTVEEFRAEVAECFKNSLIFHEELKYTWNFKEWASDILPEKTFGGAGAGGTHAFGFGKTVVCFQFRKVNEEVLTQYKTDYGVQARGRGVAPRGHRIP